MVQNKVGLIQQLSDKAIRQPGSCIKPQRISVTYS